MASALIAHVLRLRLRLLVLGVSFPLFLGGLGHLLCMFRTNVSPSFAVVLGSCQVPGVFVPARTAGAHYPDEPPYTYTGLSPADCDETAVGGADLLDRAAFPILQI